MPLFLNFTITSTDLPSPSPARRGLEKAPGTCWNEGEGCTRGGPLAVFLLCFRTWLCVRDAIYWLCSPSDPSPSLPCCPGRLFRHFLTRAQMKAGWKAPGALMSRNKPLADFKGPVLTAKLQLARPSFSSSVIANLALPAGERLAHI